jgi:hypothetical protein
VTLLSDALHAGGGLDLWRQMRRFTVHISISGALCARKCRDAQLKELVAEGGTQQQALEITGFTANDRRALYRPNWVALEGLDGRRWQERYAAPATFREDMRLAVWDDLQLAHYCGYLIWNYVAVPFILADSDVITEELESSDAHGESWRRLKVEFPPRVVTHSAKQTFYFDREGLLRRVDYPAIDDDQTQTAQVFWEHQRFSGILVPTLCRMLKVGATGVLMGEPPLVDIEIFDALFE